MGGGEAAVGLEEALEEEEETAAQEGKPVRAQLDLCSRSNPFPTRRGRMKILRRHHHSYRRS